MQTRWQRSSAPFMICLQLNSSCRHVWLSGLNLCGPRFSSPPNPDSLIARFIRPPTTSPAAVSPSVMLGPKLA